MRGAIFDLDGTLADTSADLLAAANAALRPSGLPMLDPLEDRNVAGRGGRAMIRRSLEIAGRDPNGATEIELTDALYPKLLEAYSENMARETQLYEGVHDCLDELARRSWRLGVCTNKPEFLAVPLLKILGVADKFGAVLGADTLPVRKPDPEHIWETARRIGAVSHRSVMIGDTQTDLSASRAAGVPCVLTTFGFSVEPVDTMGGDAVVDSFNALPEVLETLSPA